MPELDPPWTQAERAVLRARAERILRAFQDGEQDQRSPTEAASVIVVSSAGASVALPEPIVLGVRRLLQLTVVHGPPPTFLGVFAHDETVLPAYRLSSLLGLPPRPSERPFVLVIGRNAPELGLEVDRVLGPDVCVPGSPTPEHLCMATGGTTPSGAPVLDADALFNTPSLAVS